MYLSISLDARPEEDAATAFRQIVARADRIEAAAADFVLLARETDDGVTAPGRIEAIVQAPWIAGRLRTPVIVAAIPAVHSVPFHIARALSAIDFLSDGRAGWMPLASDRDRLDAAYGAAYGVDEATAGPKRDDFILATQALLDSWDGDALVLDKASGAYLDSTKVRRVDYRGQFFSTMGPLNAARPPQGHPLLVQDLDDSDSSAITADVVLGSLAQLASAAAPLRLLKASAATLEAALAAVAAGQADGLHLTGPDAIDLLETVRASHPRADATGATARARLGLATPANPYSQKAAA